MIIEQFSSPRGQESLSTLQGKPIPMETAQNAMNKLIIANETGGEFKPNITVGQPTPMTNIIDIIKLLSSR